MTDEPMTTETPDVSDNVEAKGEQWYSNLSEEYRNHPSIQKFTDANGLAKSYLGLESLMGRDKVPVPKGADDAKVRIALISATQTFLNVTSDKIEILLMK